MVNSKATYSSSGVQLSRAYGILDTISKSTGKPIRHFGSVVKFPFLKKLRDLRLAFSCDGVGTKIEILRELNLHWIAGWDAVAMNANDLLCVGAKPLWFLDYYAQGRLNQRHFKGALSGMQKALRDIGAELVGGETAELPGLFSHQETYDISGFLAGMIGETSVDVKSVRPGDLLVGLPSSGPHSNGFSLIRKILSRREILSKKTALLAPTSLYHRKVYPLLYPLSGVKSLAHITGGGFLEKLPRAIPGNCQAQLKIGSWDEPEIFKWLRKKANLSFEEAAGVWNLGIGMVLVVAPAAWPRLGERLGAQARVIGKVVRRTTGQPFVVFG